MKARALMLVVGAMLLIAACGGSDGGGDGETAEGQDVTVEMYDNRFQYTEIRVPVGGTVTFVGAGQNPHNAVEANGAWSTEDEFGSLDQLEGDEATLTYDEAGEYVFFCSYHGNSEGDGMAGTLIVGEG
jgi:plastocyanin